MSTHPFLDFLCSQPSAPHPVYFYFYFYNGCHDSFIFVQDISTGYKFTCSPYLHPLNKVFFQTDVFVWVPWGGWAWGGGVVCMCVCARARERERERERESVSVCVCVVCE